MPKSLYSRKSLQPELFFSDAANYYTGLQVWRFLHYLAPVLLSNEVPYLWVGLCAWLIMNSTAMCRWCGTPVAVRLQCVSFTLHLLSLMISYNKYSSKFYEVIRQLKAYN